MNSEEAIQYFNDEIRLCRAATSINGCQMTEDWQRTIDACEIAVAAIRKVHELEQAEQDGRMVVLPCKVGDTVYWIHNGIITDCRVHRVQMNRTGLFICLKSKVSHGAFRVDICLGKTVFLTHEEAEAALAGKGISE